MYYLCLSFCPSLPWTHTHLFTTCWFYFYPYPWALLVLDLSVICLTISSNNAAASSTSLAQALHLPASQYVTWHGWILQCPLFLIYSFLFSVLFILWQQMKMVGFVDMCGILEQDKNDWDFFLEALWRGLFTSMVFLWTWKGNRVSQQDIDLG